MDNLFKDFSPVHAADWKARLEKDLKGITFEQLSSTDRNGIVIHPFYNKEDITIPPAPVSTQPGWSICARITVSDAAAANKQALEELNNGASGLCFVLEGDTDPAVLLQGIELPYIYTQFRLSPGHSDFARQLQAYCKANAPDKAVKDLFVSFDSIAHYLQQGRWHHSQAADLETYISLRETMGKAGPLVVEATAYQNAGATAAYELACTLAQVNEYLNILNERQQLTTISKIHLSLATDTTFFGQIAKLRACRKLLQLLLKSYGLELPLHLHVETSDSYRSPFDSYSNLLRDTIAAMAAVTGGCDSLYIRPFDAAVQTEHDFSRRMSRNQQLIFKEESYLDKVADVAAGSYYIETITEQLAAKAWEQFKAIEQAGGLIRAWEQGTIKEQISSQAGALIDDYKEGKKVLIGVNKYPNPQDPPQAAGAEPPVATHGLQPLSLSQHII